MRTRLNGTTQKIDRRQQDCFGANQRHCLGFFQSASRCSGHESVGSYSAGSGGDNSIRESHKFGETNFDGKILERLEYIEEAHFAYLENQRKSLENQIEENKAQTEKLKQSISELKKQVYELIKKN